MGHILVDGIVPGTQLKFVLSNIHFHTPSEHTLESNRYSIEAHFVHSLDSSIDPVAIGLNRTKMVIGVLFDATSQTMSQFLYSLNLHNSSIANIDVTQFMTEESTNEAYFYEGSLTTPECNEVVNWVVKKRPVECTLEQLRNFTKSNDQNYRELQALNGRPITYFIIEQTEQKSTTGLYSVLAVIVACIFAFIVIFI